jgi:hypothetical protein
MALNNVISKSFTGVNLIMLSLVEETEPKDYQDKYFMFIKAIPSVRSDTSSSGKSYDHKSAVTFKMSAERAYEMSFALSQYALGRGKLYDEQFGNFVIFADGSKSQYGNNSKKAMNVNYFLDQKSKKTKISVFTSSDQTKIPFFMNPYEASSMAEVLKFFANECLRLEIAGPGVVISRQPPRQKPTQNNNQGPFNQQQASVPPQQPQAQPNLFNQTQPVTQQPNVTADKVANDFAGFLNDNDTGLPF